jgi:hypothetical protein
MTSVGEMGGEVRQEGCLGDDRVAGVGFGAGGVGLEVGGAEDPEDGT